MTVLQFSGSTEALVTQLEALIAAAATINEVIVTHVKACYIILYTP